MITHLTETEKERFLVRMICGYLFGLVFLFAVALSLGFYGSHPFGISVALAYMFLVLTVSLPLLVLLTFLGLRYASIILRHPQLCSVGGVLVALAFSMIFSHRDGFGPSEIVSLIVSIPAAAFFAASMRISPVRH